MGSDNRSSEWVTAVGNVANHEIRVRGYSLEQLIGAVSFPSIVFLTLLGELPSPAQERTFDAAICSIVEHALYAPTTYAARIIASTNYASIMPAVSGAMLTIGGVTASPQDTAEMISQIKTASADGRSVTDAAASYVADAASQKRRIPGFGHPLHPTGDPRASALKRVAVQEGTWGEGCDIVEAVSDAVSQHIGKRLPINIDGMLGGVLTDLGFRPLQMPGIAGLSFMPGIIAHSVEEIEQSRHSPSLRVVTDIEYVGHAPRELDL